MDVNTWNLELVGVAIFTQQGLLKIVYSTRVTKKQKIITQWVYSCAVLTI